MITQSLHLVVSHIRLVVELDARRRRMLFELLGIAVLFAIGVGFIVVRVAMVLGTRQFG